MEAEKGYRECMDGMRAIPEEELSFCNIPLDVATAEARALAVVAVEDREALIRAGIDPLYVDSLAARAGAFTYTAARYELVTGTDPEAKRLWKEESPKGYALQRVLLRTYAFAYRKDKELKKAVARIREGKGHKEMVFDLLALSLLGTLHSEPLEKIPMFDRSQVGEAKTLHTRLADLLARMTVDPQKVEAAKSELDHAYSYYKEAADEVKDHGQFVFEGTPRYQSYLSQYHQELGEMSGEVEIAPVIPNGRPYVPR